MQGALPFISNLRRSWTEGDTSTSGSCLAAAWRLPGSHLAASWELPGGWKLEASREMLPSQLLLASRQKWPVGGLVRRLGNDDDACGLGSTHPMIVGHLASDK